MATTIEFENDRVRVLLVTHAPHEQHQPTARHDRLIVYLEDGSLARTVAGKQETLQRKAGDVMWRDGSQHQIENLTGHSHAVIIVELK